MLTKGRKSGTIRLGINLFDKSEPLYIDAFSIEEIPGFEDVYLHGSSKSVQIKRDGKAINLDAAAFAALLKERGYSGGDIRLVSCSTGAGDNSFAQQLSKILGVKVKAPTMDAYYAPDEGTVFIGAQNENIGKWRTFEKGVEIYD